MSTKEEGNILEFKIPESKKAEIDEEASFDRIRNGLDKVNTLMSELRTIANSDRKESNDKIVAELKRGNRRKRT